MVSVKTITVLVILSLGLACIPTVGATEVNFQTLSDYEQLQYLLNYYHAYYYSDGFAEPYINGTGGNNMLYTHGYSWCGQDPTAYAFPYATNEGTQAAGTIWSGGTTYLNGTAGIGSVRFYDASKNVLGTLTVPIGITGGGGNVRILVKLVGDQMFVYRNGVAVANTTALAINPTYIGFGHARGGQDCTSGGWTYWDDMVWGNTAENAYVFDQPQKDTYIIKRDIYSTPASGFAYSSNLSIISSYYMPVSYSKGTNTNETVKLMNWATKTVYATHNTGTNYTELFSWDVYNNIINSTAPFGWYVTTIDGTNVSNPILYETGGANLSWDRTRYANGDTGIVSYNISTAYFDTATYTYSIALMDAYGTFHGTNATVFNQYGTVSESFTSALPSGVYYALMVATPKAGGAEIVLAYAPTELTEYIQIVGYEMFYNGTIVPTGTKIYINQSNVMRVVNTTSTGFYNSTGYLTGGRIDIIANMTGYRTEYVNFTPTEAKTLDINLTLIPINIPGINGGSIGGLIREPPYYKTIPGATATIVNTTYGELYTNTSNIAGFYMRDSLTMGRYYGVNSTKTGYRNSTTHFDKAGGVT